MNETMSYSTLKDFEIMKQIGKGAFGTVYKVKRKRDGEVYAMKSINISKMDRASIDNTLNEIRILCSINHTNVVAYKEAFLDKNDTELYVVMELVGGGDIACKISECAKRKLLINEDTIWNYFVQLLCALDKLHRMKIMHRDIKSANIFLSEDFSTLKVGDLNVAKIAKNDLAHTQIGTPYYLAPEVWKNEVYGYKCDVFSLGCVLYEMAALKVPFEAGSLPELFKKVTRGLIAKIPPSYSENLYSIIKLCLTVDPRNRPSISQLMEHPLVAARLATLKPDLKSDQANLEMLMNTIRVDRGGRNKIKIDLPRHKRYRARSTDALSAFRGDNSAGSTEQVKKPIVGVQISQKEIKPQKQLEEILEVIKKVGSRQSLASNEPKKDTIGSQRKVMGPLTPSRGVKEKVGLEKMMEKSEETKQGSASKLPPLKAGVKKQPPLPNRNVFANQASAQNGGPKAGELSKNDHARAQSPQVKKYNDYLEKLIQQNNNYLKNNKQNENVPTKEKTRMSSAEPQRRDNNYVNPSGYKYRPLWGMY